ncbi:MAG: PBP1A family penicillin-binding protein [Alphaproteobacteria bacterium]|nr:PBP1A family penicillin-binding protein [Alphaproteobacteria bacterium]
MAKKRKTGNRTGSPDRAALQGVAGGVAAVFAYLGREAVADFRAGVASFAPKKPRMAPSAKRPKATGAATPPQRRSPDPSPDERRRPSIAAAAARRRADEDENTGEHNGEATPGAPSRRARSPKRRPSRAPDAKGRRRGPAHGAFVAGLLNAASVAFVAALAGLYVIFIEIAPAPPDRTDLWAVNRLPSIVILDRNGEEIAARGARYGEAVRVADLPPYFVKAILATEDRRFYEHHGVDLRGVARAAITNIRAGTIAEGGSTITQQLAKNLFLSPEQSYIRKAKEALLAVWIEGRYDKDEILSLYLNRIYMGAGAYGVESAAKTYFDKSAREITLAEAAMLAGLPKAPSALSPTSNPFGAQDRAAEVLDNLAEAGLLDAAEVAAARADPAKVVSAGAGAEIGYFFDMVAERARALAPEGQKDLVVRTTIDLAIQRAAETALTRALSTEAKIAGAEQGALVAYDNRTGAMRAMVGGRSYVESQFNRATQAKRQPGSAFKPFVYAAALENGMTPATRMVDQPIDIAGWRPSNYSNRFDGPMRLTEAVAQSVNTVAVQVSEAIGREKVIDVAHRLGISSDIPTEEAGVALGGFNLTLEELTAAYMPFARGGRAAAPHAIESIEDRDGRVVYAFDPGPETRALDERVARDMTHLLYQVMVTGTGARARLPGRDAVGKTGTTNDWRDAWFVGYTDQITAGVWIGNDDYQPMKKVTGGTIPAEIWREFMIAAHDGLQSRRLPGAFVAETFADEAELAQFYEALAQDLQRVMNGRSVRGRDRRFLGNPDFDDRGGR